MAAGRRSELDSGYQRLPDQDVKVVLQLVEERMVGRAGDERKSEVLWDEASLEGLLIRLEGEFDGTPPSRGI